MAVGIDADSDYIERASIPSGGAGTLTEGAFTDFFVGVWLYRPTSGNTWGTTASGYVIHGQAGAREIGIYYTPAGSTLDDPQLAMLWDSGGGSGYTVFADQPPRDAWVYYCMMSDASTMTAAWRELGSDTWHSETAANSNAGSQYINTLTIGNMSTATCVMGNYAYARAVDATKDLTEALAYSKSTTTASGDWGFWPLDDNSDTGDDSGNGRTLTFGGSLSSETSPTLDGYLLTQHGYRWRLDDGSESGATWAAAQNSAP